jgi:hypothetical protein
MVGSGWESVLSARESTAYRNRLSVTKSNTLSGTSATLLIHFFRSKKQSGEQNIMQRSEQQNKAMHKYFSMLADALNNAGLDQRQVLKPGVDIPWTPEAVKKQLWHPIESAMYDKDSTADLDKVEVGRVYEVLNRHLAEKLGISVEFPDRFGPTSGEDYAGESQ